MGGYLSGRYRTRNRGTVESACRVDLRFLRSLGALKDGSVSAGTLRWTRYGEETGSAGYSADLTSPDSRQLIVSFTCRGDAKRVVIPLEAVPMRFGGFRFYARCPLSGRRCEVLPIVGGIIACRQVHRLTYATQSEDWLGRLGSRANRLETALKKRRRRGANRERLLGAWAEASIAFEQAVDREALRRFGTVF